jgi:hypothetical protein
MRGEMKQISIAVLITWLLLVIFFMILARNISIEIFFVLWLIGLFMIVELISPSFVHPLYTRYLRFLIAAGVLVFAVIIIQKVTEILRI